MEEPRYAWRGFHLDSARTFWPVEVVLEVLELMSRYKLNRLSWHLTDDQGWRFAVPGYERLVEVSAHLSRPTFDHYNNVLQEKREAIYEQLKDQPWGGWYSDDDIAQVLARADELGIEVMPELDLPGHMAAVIRAYPHLGNPALAELPIDEWTRNDLLWPNDEAFDFLRAALNRLADLFPSRVIHIGGDECRYFLWEGDDELMAAAQREGIQTARELQGKFTRFAKTVLEERGRQIAGWDELCLTPLTGDELILAWQEGKGVDHALQSQNPWIYCDADYLYLNRLQGPAEQEPCGMWEILTPQMVLEAPIPDNERMIGVQASMWCEFVTDRELLMYHVFPRLLAFAERAWCGENALPWPELKPRIQAELEYLSSIAVVGRPLD
ncbi:MAG: family 20 glycosylhydrolase [Propionibacteriaceae bacterium]|nr:family 20 glycosylhydrolase [Propionibacteriaceae bacterium]